MKVSLIIFAWNEIDGMKVIMPQIKKEWYDQLLIVDGGSTDGTIEYAREHGYELFVQKEKGSGAAFLESIAKAAGGPIPPEIAARIGAGVCNALFYANTMTDLEGKPCVDADLEKEVRFLSDEIDWWLNGILKKNWAKRNTSGMSDFLWSRENGLPEMK